MSLFYFDAKEAATFPSPLLFVGFFDLFAPREPPGIPSINLIASLGAEGTVSQDLQRSLSHSLLASAELKTVF
jgi:hypothetical protein